MQKSRNCPQNRVERRVIEFHKADGIFRLLRGADGHLHQGKKRHGKRDRVVLLRAHYGLWKWKVCSMQVEPPELLQKVDKFHQQIHKSTRFLLLFEHVSGYRYYGRDWAGNEGCSVTVTVRLRQWGKNIRIWWKEATSSSHL